MNGRHTVQDMQFAPENPGACIGHFRSVKRSPEGINGALLKV